MKKISLLLSLTVAILAASGCITHVSVVRVTDDTVKGNGDTVKGNRDTVKGERVKLPAPFIVGNPTPDGTIKYTVQYFPDPDQEYAINTWSFLAKQKTDIGRSVEMYVNKMTLAQDSTAVAAQLATSAGAIGKGAVDTLVTKQQTEITADIATAKAKKDNVTAKTADVATKTAAVEKAQVIVESAQQTLYALTNAPNPEAAAIKAAQTALTNAKLTLDQDQIDLKYAKAALVTASNADQAAPPDIPKAKGIVIYEIHEEEEQGLKLVPVNFSLFSMDGKPVVTNVAQLEFETAGTKGGGAPATSRMNPLKTEISVDKTMPDTLSQDLSFNTEIKAIDPATTFKDVSQNDMSGKIKVTSSKMTVIVAVDSSVPVGRYKLQLKLTFSDNQTLLYVVDIKVK